MKGLILSLLFIVTVKLSAQVATEGASTVEKNTFRIENINFLNFDNSSNNKLWDFNSLFRIGVAKRVELRVGHDYFINRFSDNNGDGIENLSGFGDMNAGIKVELFNSQEEGKFDFALMGTYSFPTGAGAFSSGNFYTNHMLLFANAITDDIGVEYNIGYQDGEEKGDIIYTFSIGASVVKDLGAFVEYYGALVNLNEAEHNIDFGFNYSIKDHFQVDATFGLPLMKKPESSFISIGVYYTFAKRK